MKHHQRSSDDKHHHDDDKGQQILKEQEEKLESLQSKLVQKQQKLGIPCFISSDDFFNKNQEFRVWLLNRHKSKKGKSKKHHRSSRSGDRFEELSTNRAKKLFEKFVKKWNDGKLDEALYRGLRSTELSNIERTTFHWNLKDVNQFELDLCRDTVDTNTFDMDWNQQRQQELQQQKKSHSSSLGDGHQGGKGTGSSHRSRRGEYGDDEYDDGRPSSVGDRIMAQEDRQASKQRDNRMYRKRRREDLEELVPRPDPGSYEAKRQKQRMTHEKIHGSRDALSDDEYGSYM